MGRGLSQASVSPMQKIEDLETDWWGVGMKGLGALCRGIEGSCRRGLWRRRAAEGRDVQGS